jgi:hypothetical protein
MQPLGEAERFGERDLRRTGLVEERDPATDPAQPGDDRRFASGARGPIPLSRGTRLLLASDFLALDPIAETPRSRARRFTKTFAVTPVSASRNRTKPSSGSPSCHGSRSSSAVQSKRAAHARSVSAIGSSARKSLASNSRVPRESVASANRSASRYAPPGFSRSSVQAIAPVRPRA